MECNFNGLLMYILQWQTVKSNGHECLIAVVPYSTNGLLMYILRWQTMKSDGRECLIAVVPYTINVYFYDGKL